MELPKEIAVALKSLAWDPIAQYLAHDREPARVAVLRTKAVEDPLDGVALLAGRRLILLQDLVNDGQERIELGSLSGLPLSIAWRLGIAQDIFSRVFQWREKSLQTARLDFFSVRTRRRISVQLCMSRSMGYARGS